MIRGIDSVLLGRKPWGLYTCEAVTVMCILPYVHMWPMYHNYHKLGSAPPYLDGSMCWTNVSSTLMKVRSELSLRFLQISMCLGIPTSDSRPCTIATDLHLLCVLGILLYCPEKHHHGDWLIYTGGCSFAFLHKLRNYCYFWHPRGIFVTKATFSHPLSPPYPAFWGTKWNQFINHQVTTYPRSQGALAVVKSTWSTQSDTCHKSKTWSVSCCSFWLCETGHAWWLGIGLLSVLWVLNFLWTSFW